MRQNRKTLRYLAILLLVFGKYGQFRWHGGIGFGLTEPADNIIVKAFFPGVSFR